MKLAVMQPYFFPYLGYFQLIKAADRFVLADEVQYIRHGWINRNRILSNNGEHQYIIVPVKKHHLNTLIKDVSIVDNGNWKNEILKKLEVYKKAPFYKSVIAFIEQCFSFQATAITAALHHHLTQTCRYIGIENRIEIQSSLKLDFTKVENKTDRVLQFCSRLNADTYINLPGGTALYDKTDFKNNGIELKFIQPKLQPYRQLTLPFVPALSIIDVMMFNAPEEIKKMMNAYELI